MKNARLVLSDAWKKELLRLRWLLLLVPAILLPALAFAFPYAVETIYSQGLFPILRTVWNFLFGLFPFSVAEWLLYVLAVGIPLSLITLFLLAIIKRIAWMKLMHVVISYLIAFTIALNAFYVLWGFNYSRPTLGTLLHLDVRARSVEELERACYALASQANRLRDEMEEDENGVYAIPGGIAASFSRIPEAYHSLGKQIPLFDGYIAAPKPVLASESMSYLGICGIYIPFTAEANVNVHQPELLLPASAAHESAHALGIAREDEANFVAYLACSASNDKALQYSGIMLSLIHCGNELYSADRDAYAALYGTYSEGMLRDLDAHNAYWKRYEGPAQEAMTQINDDYLKYNNQQSGVQSYGQMVDLLLAWFALHEA